MSVFRHGLGKLFDKIKHTEFSEQNLVEIKDEIFRFLIESHVAFDIATLIVTMLTMKIIAEDQKYSRFTNPGAQVRQILKKELFDKLSAHEASPLLVQIKHRVHLKNTDDEPVIILFVGINGAGKTTTLAKVGHLLVSNQISTIFAAGDTYRAGAVSQLEGWADKIGVQTVSVPQPAKPMTVMYDALDKAKAESIDVILADTSGRMENDRNLLRELLSISNRLIPDFTIFVGDCHTGSALTTQLRTFQGAITVDGIILTKFDSDDTGGAVLTTAYSTEKPIYFLSNGQDFGDLIAFNASDLIEQIF